ncbi:HAD-IB family hydrolase [Acidimicrobiales bacterium]|jgi:putative phosphoserine phosphatase / 1-acylglycerol-3-phosphate O-acyltransferase|nr:HAD-IB family hydrolase [Acidimicrobiaceae bacterium]MDB4103075.1 HAD-IB family hydrolase [Acidimicrobiales bacterium]MDB4205694.1 HAD-IB family hydrolase [bacterium]MDC1390235.1 HAD-IB family hydrolase [Acidimicrobiales bacterium]MDG1086939.1 HAD-IB family hydrolase [Acidimicrobiales bacterium]
MSHAAAFFDLDRTLIRSSSAPVFARYIAEAGITEHHDIPLANLFLKFYEEVGESRLTMVPAKLSVRTSRGWNVAAVAKASAAASQELLGDIQPFAAGLFEKHRADGLKLVLATTSPEAFVRPLADALGFDDVICTKWKSADGSYLGEIDGAFVWGTEKADAVAAWAEANDVRLDRSYAYSDSYYDSPMLDLVGHPVAVNPDPNLTMTATIKGWPIRHLDKNEGVVKIAGREIQEWSRPFMRPEIVAPYANITFDGLANIPETGGAILVFNHRSYFDTTVMGLLAARSGRNIRGLGKKEVFDAPIIGKLMAAIGGVRVERASGSDEPLLKAAEAIAGGEAVMIAPEGTIPRGPAFFETELKGRWGAAKLAAMTKAPVIPIGLWGTENVWPRSSRLPRLLPVDRPNVSAVVGEPVALDYTDVDADTTAIMKAIMALLPDEAREKRTPTADELARTYPPGYKGDPNAEAVRRPGTDT